MTRETLHVVDECRGEVDAIDQERGKRERDQRKRKIDQERQSVSVIKLNDLRFWKEF